MTACSLHVLYATLHGTKPCDNHLLLVPAAH
jgi:hypothetical protein